MESRTPVADTPTNRAMRTASSQATAKTTTRLAGTSLGVMAPTAFTTGSVTAPQQAQDRVAVARPEGQREYKVGDQQPDQHRQDQVWHVVVPVSEKTWPGRH